MRQIFLLLVLVLTLTTSFSQEHISSKPVTKEDFIKRSKSQKAGAWILLGIGVTAIATAAPGNVDFGTAGVLAVVGTVGTLTSIPLFLAAGRNKRRARAMSSSFKMEQWAMPGNTALKYNYYPSFLIRLRL